jgi:hypothetical protein
MSPSTELQGLLNLSLAGNGEHQIPNLPVLQNTNTAPRESKSQSQELVTNGMQSSSNYNAQQSYSQEGAVPIRRDSAIPRGNSPLLASGNGSGSHTPALSQTTTSNYSVRQARPDNISPESTSQLLPEVKLEFHDPITLAHYMPSLRIPVQKSPGYSSSDFPDLDSYFKYSKMAFLLDRIEQSAMDLEALQTAHIPMMNDPKYRNAENPTTTSGFQYDQTARHAWHEAQDGLGDIVRISIKARDSIKRCAQARFSTCEAVKNREHFHDSVAASRRDRHDALQKARDRKIERLQSR